MPLHGENESLIGTLQSFDDAVAGARRDVEAGARLARGLVVPGVDAPAVCTRDSREQAARFDCDVVRGLGLIFETGPVQLGAQVLNERAAVINVQNLETTADGKQRQVAVKRLSD